MKNSKMFLKAFDNLEPVFLTVTFTCMAVVCFVQVVTRYLLHFSLPWSEEFLRAMFVWSSCLGISLGVRNYSHLGVDAIVSLFPMRARKILGILANIIFIIFCGLIVYFSLKVTLKQYRTHQTTIAMRLPVWIISSALPFGFTLTIIRTLQNMYDSLTKQDQKGRQEGEPHVSEGLL